MQLACTGSSAETPGAGFGGGGHSFRRMVPLVAAVLALGLLASGCSTKKSEAQLASDALNKGLAAQRAGRLQEAATDYREVLVHDPQNKFAYFDLGVLDQQSNRLTSAEANYRLALDIDPDFTPALFNLAIIRTGAGAIQEAIKLYQHAIVVDPNYTSAHLNLGFLLLQIGDTKQAQKEFDIAVSQDPSMASRIPPLSSSPSPQPVASPTP